MYLYTRREVLRLPLPAVALVFNQVHGLAFKASERKGLGRRRLNWDSFVNRVALLSKQSRHKRCWDQDKYVKCIGMLAKRLNYNDPRFHCRECILTPRSGYPGFVDLERQVNVEFKLLAFVAGDTIDAHDHPEMAGVMTCIGGRVSVESFDRAGALEPSGNILLRRISRKVLAENDISTLTACKGNIHRLEADVDCDLLDVLTPPYDDKKIADTRWYSIDSSCSDVRTGICGGSVVR